MQTWRKDAIFAHKKGEYEQNVISNKAQNNEITMDNNQRTKTIRLVYPQWQGGDIAHWITEVKDPEQASRGYYLRAQLLNFLAPDSGQETYTVPVATDKIERKVTDGVLDKGHSSRRPEQLWIF